MVVGLACEVVVFWRGVGDGFRAFIAVANKKGGIEEEAKREKDCG